MNFWRMDKDEYLCEARENSEEFALVFTSEQEIQNCSGALASWLEFAIIKYILNDCCGQSAPQLAGRLSL